MIPNLQRSLCTGWAWEKGTLRSLLHSSDDVSVSSASMRDGGDGT